MTDNYYNFAGTTVDPSEVAAQIKTEISKSKESPSATDLDKFTVRSIARVVDATFSEFLEDLEFRLRVSLGTDIDLDRERFLTIYESICDTAEEAVIKQNKLDEELASTDETEYALLEYYDEDEDYYDDEFLDSEDYDFENPRY